MWQQFTLFAAMLDVSSAAIGHDYNNGGCDDIGCAIVSWFAKTVGVLPNVMLLPLNMLLYQFADAISGFSDQGDAFRRYRLR